MTVTTGEKIKTLRRSLGLTQKELAGLIGVSSGMIRMVENGLLLPEKAETLNRALDTGCADLIEMKRRAEPEPLDLVNIIEKLKIDFTDAEELYWGSFKMSKDDIRMIIDAMKLASAVSFSRNRPKSNNKARTKNAVQRVGP